MQIPFSPEWKRFLRSMAYALLALIVLGATGGCGKSALERQQEYRQRTATLNDFDTKTVLAGRDPAALLETALMDGGCIWLSKGLVSASKNRLVVTGAHYNEEMNQVRVEQYSEYNWGLGKVHRTTTVVHIPVAGLEAYVHPPSHSGEYQCWTLYFSCPEKDGIRYDQHFQLIGGSSISDEGSKSGRTISRTLSFSDKNAAIEACAALRALAER